MNSWLNPIAAAVFIGLSSALLVDIAQAQPKPGYIPSSTHIFPAGGQRGTSVHVCVGTECAPPGTNFYLIGQGVRAAEVLGSKLSNRGQPSPRRLPTEIPITYPREWDSQIEIAADAPLGPVSWWLSCAQGGTGSRPFVVGDLPEVIESESNSTPEKAQRVSLPVTLNGQISGERDADYYRFSVPPGSIVACEVLAGRLGSRLDPVIEILDQHGREVIVECRHVGSDPVVAFRAETSDSYLLRIANVSMHGSPAHVYRINLTTLPYIQTVFPAGGAAGSEVDIEFRTLSGNAGPGGADVPSAAAAVSQLIHRKVKIPSTTTGWFEYRDPEFANRVLLAVDELPNIAEREPNERTAAMELSCPVTVHGRLAATSDEDCFVFSARKEERFTIECRAVPAGSSACPTVSLSAADGKQLAMARSVDSTDGIVRIEWKSSADDRYQVRIRDLQFGTAGGDDFIYRLSIRPSRPDFELSLASDCLNVLQGGTATVDIVARRLGGFEGPIDLQLSGMPETVTIDARQIPANTASFKLNLKASDAAIAAHYSLQISGRATIDNQMVEHLAQARHLGVDSEGVSVSSPTHEQIHLTVQHKPVFRLFCSEAYMYAHRGSVYPYLMEVERLNGFDGPITLQIGDRQNRDLDGIEMREVVIAPGQTQVRLPIYLPESMHINVQSQSQLYSQAYATFTDEQQRTQSVLVLSEKRNMLRTLPPVVKLKAMDEELVKGPGGELTCRFRIERTSNYSGPLQLELVPTQTGVAVEPVTIAADQTEVTVRVANAAPAAEPVTVTFRATGRMADNTEVISEDQVNLVP